MKKNILVHVDAKGRGAKVDRVDVHENESLPWCAGGEVRRFDKDLHIRGHAKRYFKSTRWHTDIAIQRVAADFRCVSVRNPQCGRVSGALVGLGILQVWRKQGILRVDEELRIDERRLVHMVIAKNPQVRPAMTYLTT